MPNPNRIDPLAPPDKPNIVRPQATFPRVATIVLTAVSAAVVTVSTFLPPPWGTLLQVVGFVSGAIAGVGGGVPKLVEGKPVLQGTAVAFAGGAGAMLANLSDSVAEGPVKIALQGLALLGFWLAGKQATFGAKNAKV